MIPECNNYNGHFYSVEIGGRSVVTYSENNNTIKKAIVDSTEVTQLRHLNSMMTDTVFTKHRDLLFPGPCTLVKSLSKAEVFELFLKGYKPVLYIEEHCFIDQSSSLEINKDFMKLVSVFPIYLQAKNLNSASIVASILIVVIDFFSYYPNLLWQHFKKHLYYFSKLCIAKWNLRARRCFHVFLSSISDGFMYSDSSSHKSYHTDVCEFYVVEPCILPSYVERVIEVNHAREKNLANKDGDEHTYEFVVNLNTHVIRYKYQRGTFTYDHKLNGDVIEIWSNQMDEDDFQATLSYYDDIKRMEIYPARTLTEDGVRLIAPKSVFKQMYPYRGLKVVVKKGVFVC